MHVLKLPMTGFFVELNLHKTKWLLFCIYDPHKKYISDFLQEFWKALDQKCFKMWFEKLLCNLLFEQKFLNNLIVSKTHRTTELPPPSFSPVYIYFLLIKPIVFETLIYLTAGLSDFHKMTPTVFKGKFTKCKPKMITYSELKNFSNEAFRQEVLSNINMTTIGSHTWWKRL